MSGLRPHAGWKTAVAGAALLLLAACATGKSHYQINVGNGHPATPVRDVRVAADGKELPEFERIAPSKVAASKPRKGSLPDEITVSWTSADGTVHSDVVQVDDRVRSGFTGQLILEITPEETVTLTPVDSGDKELSTMPWAMPESWEGAVSIPGMEE